MKPPALPFGPAVFACRHLEADLEKSAGFVPASPTFTALMASHVAPLMDRGGCLALAQACMTGQRQKAAPRGGGAAKQLYGPAGGGWSTTTRSNVRHQRP